MVASVLAIALALPASAGTADGYMALAGDSYLASDAFDSGTGDMEFVFYAAADDWSNGTQVVIGHWPKSASKQAVRIQFNRYGHLQFIYKDPGGTLRIHNAFAAQMNLRNGKGAWFRIRFNAASDGKSITKFQVSKQAVTTNPSKAIRLH